jgi:hypothetical protein
MFGMKINYLVIIAILLLSSCSNLKYLEAFDGYRGQPKKVEFESYRVVVENDRQIEKLGYSIVTYYDEVGRKVRTEDYKSDGSPSTGGTVYSYDKKGNLTKITMYKLDGAINIQNSFKYNKHGQRTERLYTTKTDTIKTVFIFDRKNRIEEIKGWYRDGSFKEYAIQKYDRDWREKELISYDSLGHQTSRIVFEHNKNGNQSSSKWYNSNDELYNIYEKSYNSKNDPVRSKKYHLKDGDTIKIRIEKSEYDYDTYGNIKEHRLYTEGDLTLVRRYNFTY